MRVSKLEFGCIAELVARGGVRSDSLLADNRRTIELLQDHFRTVWFDDHFHKDHSPVFESWTTLSYLTSLYPNLRFGTLVLCQSYRNPGLLAKMTATLQVLSSGRFIAGIGAGWKQDEYEAYNYPFPSARIRIDQLEELAQILRLMWTRSPASFSGKHYQITNAECDPIPDPPPPLLIGGGGEKRTLRVVAKYADWMNIAFPDQEVFKHKLNVLKKHCDEENRPYDQIKKSMWTYVKLVKQKETNAVDSHGRHIIAGTPEAVADEINGFKSLGIDHIMIRFVDFPQTNMAEMFINEVIPAIHRS
jgi:alkanesulfonate monooxygenase SsuD/methylene tetrahydromethanopterin reductase-like flavin-dependent oxidoreductase (luciferase family)